MQGAFDLLASSDELHIVYLDNDELLHRYENIE